MIRHKLGNMATKIYAAESMAYRTSGMIDAYISTVEKSSAAYDMQQQKAPEEYAIECSILKVFGSETLAYVPDEPFLYERLTGREFLDFTARLYGLDRATYEQRLAIIDCLHAVAAADHKILNAEATEIGRTARELKVEQSDLSNIRARYGAHLEARKGLGG